MLLQAASSIAAAKIDSVTMCFMALRIMLNAKIGFFWLRFGKILFIMAEKK